MVLPPQPLRPSFFAKAMALLVGVLLWASGLAASWEPLHEWLHHHAGQSDHECAVTLLAQGAVSFHSPEPLRAAPATWQWVEVMETWSTPWVASAFAVSGVQEHAPPVAA